MHCEGPKWADGEQHFPNDKTMKAFWRESHGEGSSRYSVMLLPSICSPGAPVLPVLVLQSPLGAAGEPMHQTYLSCGWSCCHSHPSLVLPAFFKCSFNYTFSCPTTFCHFFLLCIKSLDSLPGIQILGVGFTYSLAVTKVLDILGHLPIPR